MCCTHCGRMAGLWETLRVWLASNSSQWVSRGRLPHPPLDQSARCGCDSLHHLLTLPHFEIDCVWRHIIPCIYLLFSAVLQWIAKISITQLLLKMSVKTRCGRKSLNSRGEEIKRRGVNTWQNEEEIVVKPNSAWRRRRKLMHGNQDLHARALVTATPKLV